MSWSRILQDCETISMFKHLKSKVLRPLELSSVVYSLLSQLLDYNPETHLSITFFHKYTFPFFSLRGELDLRCPDSLPRPRDQHESRVFGDHSVMIRQHPDTGAVSYFESSNDLCWPIIGHLQCFFLFFFYWKLFWLELSASIHTQTQSIILMINRHER